MTSTYIIFDLSYIACTVGIDEPFLISKDQDLNFMEGYKLNYFRPDSEDFF